jgi:hypothetical protein
MYLTNTILNHTKKPNDVMEQSETTIKEILRNLVLRIEKIRIIGISLH